MNLQLQNYKNRHSVTSKVARGLWAIVWLFLFRPTPNRIRFFLWWRILLLRMFGAKIGSHCVVMASCRIWQPWKLTMGNYACLSERVDCYNAAPITIGEQTVVSQDAFLCAASHDITSPIMELTTAPITLESQVWVCARAVVLPGVTLHEGAVLAAAAVLTHDAPAWTVLAGNPARPCRSRIIRGGGIRAEN
ncbi:MAG: putative colanic acid biosynthesis acetyltransferase [Kiritimatiellia bacterium]